MCFRNEKRELNDIKFDFTPGVGESDWNCLPFFTLNPLLLRSRRVDEEGIQSLIHVILRPIYEILVNVTLKLVDACGHNSTSRKSIPIVYNPFE